MRFPRRLEGSIDVAGGHREDEGGGEGERRKRLGTPGRSCGCVGSGSTPKARRR